MKKKRVKKIRKNQKSGKKNSEFFQRKKEKLYPQVPS
jgi:hypothetical protein